MKEIIINRNFNILKSLVQEYAPHGFVYNVPREEISYLSEDDIKDENLFNVWKQEEMDTESYQGVGVLKIENNRLCLVCLKYDDIHMPFNTQEEAKTYYTNFFK